MKSRNALFLGAILAVVPLTNVLAADKAEKLKPYPLDKCVVSDEKLGEMGKPFVSEYKGREMKFCCKSCLKDFNKDTAKYIKKLEVAEAKAKK
jgi:YHS domain-containing protein